MQTLSTASYTPGGSVAGTQVTNVVLCVQRSIELLTQNEVIFTPNPRLDDTSMVTIRLPSGGERYVLAGLA